MTGRKNKAVSSKANKSKKISGAVDAGQVELGEAGGGKPGIHSLPVDLGRDASVNAEVKRFAKRVLEEGQNECDGDDELYKQSPGYLIDRMMHARLGKLTHGISPISLNLALQDWAANLAVSPAKRTELLMSAGDKASLLLSYLSLFALDKHAEHVIEPREGDRRFNHPGWHSWPFNMYVQSFLFTEQWWDEATKDIRGVTPHHSNVMNFMSRQVVDMFSPSNIAPFNPEVIEATFKQGGKNFVDGLTNLYEDLSAYIHNETAKAAEKYIPGKAVAVTPGKVIYRNKLMELIQYSPSTGEVYDEPVFIVPAWIMKYYILDLSPHNSLVKYLVDKGHTVFMISWKNPDESDRDLGFEDYIKLGVREGIEAINAVVPDRKVHGVGYCLGGTLISAAAAAFGREKDTPFASLTLLAAQVDFKEAGELMLFTDEAQVVCMEDTMWQQGYLDKDQMAGAFNMLRSNDLVWSRLIHDYLLGKPRRLNDLMAWNSDATRMPFQMHSDYLRKLYLNNELSGGHFKVDEREVALTDIDVPVFAVGTSRDHVAPWHSVYKINLFCDTDVSFVLTSGGHNAGIVNPVQSSKYSYQYATKAKDDRYMPPEIWEESAPHFAGSWWTAWEKWLCDKSGSIMSAAPPMGCEVGRYKPLYDAPGHYVHMK